ncbi:MAG: DNA-binding response regulator [Chloroflexi bacterium HGW-Chloroflexi-5]|jgi:DNA-binding NarL/FixJ family response regulator|nr:MAG: DNA-binding response regulator [Deltaproteobacteria bacterium HGW-Deltaproteobacteria-12]PKN96587.1 MAG: DNA-binding response regulator [Chloroflexi bacterium HGW-Chloroflexi-5]
MIKVLIVDDHPVVRRGLKQIIEDEPDMEVAGEAKNAVECFALVRRTPCTIVVLDITLPDRNGFDVLKQLKSEHPALPVLILSVHPEDQYGLRFIKAGAAGYLMKEGAPEELVVAIRKVHAGCKYVSASLAERLVSRLGALDKPPHENLSDREFQILCMIAAGKSLKGIADKLCISEKTVSTYRRRILEKMKMSTNSDLIHYALENHLV